MPHTQRISPGQQRALEWLAREQGVACETCGSADLMCGDSVWPYISRMGVELRCRNQAAHVDGAATVQPFRFTLDQARAIGIDVS
jgi:hypothetical protein